MSSLVPLFATFSSLKKNVNPCLLTNILGCFCCFMRQIHAQTVTKGVHSWSLLWLVFVKSGLLTALLTSLVPVEVLSRAEFLMLKL